MRRKLALILFFAMAVFVATPAAVFAQDESGEGTEVENEGGDQADEGTDTDQGEGDQGTGSGGDDDGLDEDDPGAESGANEDQEEPAAEEEGPQWTYQMSRITLVMLLLLFLAMGALYFRMVGRRQRGA